MARQKRGGGRLIHVSEFESHYRGDAYQALLSKMNMKSDMSLSAATHYSLPFRLRPALDEIYQGLRNTRSIDEASDFVTQYIELIYAKELCYF